jgi:hypothetical protein
MDFLPHPDISLTRIAVMTAGYIKARHASSKTRKPHQRSSSNTPKPEQTRYSACGHYLRLTYLCPFQQDSYRSEPD